VSPGSVLFVRAGIDHRFHSITEDLEILVFFSSAPSR
jgi:quercetin dioxygenase-like cupin family protein